MEKPKLDRPMPLWAIWLISLLAILAWCGVHGETQDDYRVPARPAVSS
jgi:hypothetical protein